MFENDDKDDKEYFDSLNKDRKMCMLFTNISLKQHDELTNLLNNFNVDECINEIYNNHTLLQHAREYGNDFAFKSLLDHPKIDLHVKDNHDENILYKLIETNAYKLFMICIKRMDVTKIDTNFKSMNGRNLLHLASAKMDPNFFKVLFALPCSHNLYLTYRGFNLLQIALREGNIETFKVIYELWDNVSDINIYLPLHFAIYAGVDMVKFLLNLNNIDVNKRDENGQTAFYEACDRKLINVVELFLNDDRIDVNLANYDDVTPFHIVCYNKLDISNKLIQMMLNYSKIRYINLNKLDKDHRTPFYYSVMHAETERVKLLLEFDGYIDYNLHDIDGNSPFYSAYWNKEFCDVGYDQIKIVKMLLNDDRIDKSDIDKTYQTIKDNNIEYVAEILANYLNHKN